jgi:hypothetical protein
MRRFWIPWIKQGIIQPGNTHGSGPMLIERMLSWPFASPLFKCIAFFAWSLFYFLIPIVLICVALIAWHFLQSRDTNLAENPSRTVATERYVIYQEGAGSLLLQEPNFLDVTGSMVGQKSENVIGKIISGTAVDCKMQRDPVPPDDPGWAKVIVLEGPLIGRAGWSYCPPYSASKE